MKTTARNQFPGRITSVQIGPVTTQVVVQAAGGLEVVATITAASAQRLAVAVGQEAIAVVKASEIILVTDFSGFQLSARNQFAGKVGKVVRGHEASVVHLRLVGGGMLTASVTTEAVDALGIKEDVEVTAVFKAYSVILATRA